MELMEELYTQAFAYKKTKLWNKLWDGQLFAVKHWDGVISYCSVMGRGGEYTALGVYTGQEGMDSYFRALNAEPMEPGIHSMEQLCTQDCVMCSYENKDGLNDAEVAEVRAFCEAHRITLRGRKAWPKLERVRPRHIPWAIQDEEDKRRLAEALEAGVEVARGLESSTPEELGFMESFHPGRVPMLVKDGNGFQWGDTLLPECREEEYGEAGPLYDLVLERALRAKKGPATWACDIFLSPQPLSNETLEDESDLPVNAPFFPWMQMVYDVDHDLVLDCSPCENDMDYKEAFPNKLLELFAEKGKPRRMLARTDRVAALYGNLAGRLGIKLEQVDECDGLDDAIYSLCQHLTPDGDTDDDETNMAERIWDILFNCHDFSPFPDEIVMALDQIASALGDELPRGQRLMLQKEVDRRFGK